MQAYNDNCDIGDIESTLPLRPKPRTPLAGREHIYGKDLPELHKERWVRNEDAGGTSRASQKSEGTKVDIDDNPAVDFL